MTTHDTADILDVAENETVFYEINNEELVIVTETNTAVTVKRVNGDIIGKFESIVAMENANELTAYPIPETVVTDPVGYMERVLEKGIETCFDLPGYNEIGIMYADTVTKIARDEIEEKTTDT